MLHVFRVRVSRLQSACVFACDRQVGVVWKLNSVSNCNHHVVVVKQLSEKSTSAKSERIVTALCCCYKAYIIVTALCCCHKAYIIVTALCCCYKAYIIVTALCCCHKAYIIVTALCWLCHKAYVRVGVKKYINFSSSWAHTNNRGFLGGFLKMLHLNTVLSKKGFFRIPKLPSPRNQACSFFCDNGVHDL